QCLVAGVMAAVVQCLVNTKKRPGFVQVLFNVANVAISIVGSGVVFSSTWLQSAGIGLLMRLTFSAIAYFLLNTFAVTAIISLTESRPMLRLWRECYLWAFPFFFVGAGFAWGFHRLARIFGWQVAILALPGVYLMYGAYHFYLRRLQAEKSHAVDIAALHLRTIEALAMAIDAKDQTTHDHLQRVKVYASEIARELKLSRLEMEALEAAAMLHDIGKLAVPEHIVSKPGKLTPEEFEKMKIHPIVGAEILERAQFPYPVVPIVRSHHEKWDGTGYPDGLRGESIPVGARILAVVDCLDALASDRQYRKRIPLDDAMNVIASQSGISFDPKIVTILQRRYKDFEAIAQRAPVQMIARSSNTVVVRGQGPAAGFEESGVGSSQSAKIDFLTSIAAARKEVQTLFELSSDLGLSICLNNTMSIFASKLKTIIPHDSMCVFAIRDGILHPEYAAGEDHSVISALRIPVGEGLSGWVAQNNSPVINGNPAVEPGYLNDPTILMNLKSALAIPLEEDGSAIGVLSLYSRKANAFSRDHLRILRAIGPRLSVALSNGRRLSEAEDNAVTDYLTGLPNSRSLYIHLDAELARSRRTGDSLGVLFCDLDGFKKVNDEYGHLEGNRALKVVADALRDCCRNYDYVARMGGDEFVIVLPGMDETEMEQSIWRFRTAVEMAGLEAAFNGLSLSVGSVILQPDAMADDADTVLAEADRRMYANKWRRKAMFPADFHSRAA
ncbi:MAG: diguanylate cyclase, partial [Acidobacteriota bacterium]|nr:diguanylate cyclase [Acidobacteriota bacterium]